MRTLIDTLRGRRLRKRVAALALACLIASPAFAQIDGASLAATGADSVPRYFHAAGRLRDGTVMVSGGLGLTFIPPSLFSRNGVAFYNPTVGTFSTQFTPLGGGPPTSPLLATPRSSHTQTTLLDGRVLITGGHTGASGTSPGTATASVEMFDPFTGTFGSAAAMASARAEHTATLMPNGAVVVAGGSRWQIFDPVGGTWSANHALAHSRSSHAAVLLADFGGTPGDHRVLLLGGIGSGASTMELLDPAGGTTQLLTAALPEPLDDLAAVALPDGRVFVCGGQNTTSGDTVSHPRLVDPVLDTISPLPDVPNRPNGISDHETARMGRYILIMGGEEQSSGVDVELDYVAIFDTDTMTWHDDGNMLNVHDDLAAVPLDACSLLIIDGGVPFLGQEIPSNNCEIITMTLPQACPIGDINNDGEFDAADIAAFIAILLGEEVDPAFLPRADVNADGRNDARDIQPFVDVLL